MDEYEDYYSDDFDIDEDYDKLAPYIQAYKKPELPVNVPVVSTPLESGEGRHKQVRFGPGAQGGRFGTKITPKLEEGLNRAIRACIIENYNRLIEADPGTVLTGQMKQSILQGKVIGSVQGTGSFKFELADLKRARSWGGIVSTWYYTPIIIEGRGPISVSGYMKFKNAYGGWVRANTVGEAPPKDIFKLTEDQTTMIEEVMAIGLGEQVEEYIRMQEES